MKKRVGIQNFESLKMNPVLSQKSKKFIEENSTIHSDELVSKLWNKFTRLTLVHKQAKERITIDYDLKYNNHKTVALSNLVIGEVKQDKYTAHSDFIQLMRKTRIYPMRISKYCIGAVLLFKELKYNLFKPKLLMLKKLGHENITIV